MKRHRQTILTGFSLLAAFLVFALWVASHFRRDSIRVWDEESDRHWTLVLASGGVQVVRLQNASRWIAYDAETLRENEGWHTAPPRPEDNQILTGAGTHTYRELLGFRYASGAVGNVPHLGFWSVRMPLWPLALVSGLAAAWRVADEVRRVLRRKRMSKGLCPSCGYDLRASPERCPECGAASPKSNPSTQAP